MKSLVSLATRQGVSAIANARSAVEFLGSAVADRTELTRRLLDPAADDEPAPDGTLRLIPREECLQLLATRSVGRLAFLPRSGLPDIVPVNYLLDGTDVLIRSGPGPKLQAAERGDSVAFEVDDLDEGSRSGWSVVVHGTATRLNRSEQQQLRIQPEPWATGPRTGVIRIHPRSITGRRLD